MVDPLFISITADVDKLARDVVSGDFDDNAIIKEQKAAYADIIIKTHKSDWASSDNRFPRVQKIEQQLAAAYLIEYYGSGTPEELAAKQSLRDDANMSIQAILDNPTPDDESTADEPVHIIESKYVSYPAILEDDPTAGPYRSTNNQV